MNWFPIHNNAFHIPNTMIEQYSPNVVGWPERMNLCAAISIKQTCCLMWSHQSPPPLTPYFIKNKSQKVFWMKTSTCMDGSLRSQRKLCGNDTRTLSHHPYILSSRCAGNHSIESGKLKEAMLWTVYMFINERWLLSCVFIAFLMSTP